MGKTQEKITNEEYEQAFDEMARFLFELYKKVKHAEASGQNDGD